MLFELFQLPFFVLLLHSVLTCGVSDCLMTLEYRYVDTSSLTTSSFSFLSSSQELSTLGAVIVDYRGYRVFAQSIVPGMLHRMEHENVIMYGTLDNRKTFSTNKRFEQKVVMCI